MTPEHFLGEVARHFTMTSGTPSPEEKGQLSMYVAGKWYSVDLETAGSPARSCTTPSIATSFRTADAPILGIKDVEPTHAFDFVEGQRNARSNNWYSARLLSHFPCISQLVE